MNKLVDSFNDVFRSRLKEIPGMPLANWGPQFLGQAKLVNPPSSEPALPVEPMEKALFPGEFSEFSEEDFSEVEELSTGASSLLQQICHNIHWYSKSLRAGDQAGAARDLKLVHEDLDRLGDKEQELWVYLIAYCKAPAGIMDQIHASRKRQLRKRFSPLMDPEGGRLPVQTPGAIKRGPGGVIEFPPRPSGRPDVATPTTMRTQNLSPQGVSAPPLPRYTDVATGGAPRYGTDLERQIESYSQKLQEFSDRPAVATQYAGVRSQAEIQAEAKARHEEWMRRTGQGTPVPGTPVATQGGPGRCPPDAQGRPQFWDGTKCRGSIDSSAAGLISAAGGMGPSGAMMSPGAFSPGGMMPTSYQMGGRYRLENL